MSEIRTYIINLDRAADRFAAMQAQLQSLGLPYERITACDAADVTAETMNAITSPRLGRLFGHMTGYRQNAVSGPTIYWPEIGRYFVAGEVACYLSHSLALQRFLESGADAAVIFEDDVEIDPDLADVIRAIDHLPPRARIVKLEGIQASYQARMPVARIGGRAIAMMLKPTTGAAGYYVNRAAAKQIVPQLFPVREPFDAFLRQYWLHGIEVLEARPFPVRQRPLKTSIQDRDGQRRASLPLPYTALRGVCIPALKLSRLLRRALFLAKYRWRSRHAP
jgi:glycosyl transferase, family 25